MDNKTENKVSFWNSLKVKIIIILLTTILIVMMFPHGESIESNVSVGSIWINKDLIASKPFRVLKDPKVYKRQVEAARKSVYPIFVLNKNISKTVNDSINDFNKFLLLTIDYQLKNKNVQPYTPQFLTPNSFNVLKQIRQAQLDDSLKTKSLNDIFKIINRLSKKIYRRGLLDRDYASIARDTIFLRVGKYERVVLARTYFDDANVKRFIQSYLKSQLGDNQKLITAVSEYVYHFIAPNIKFSKKLTKEAIKAAVDKIPLNDGIVNENERIVAKHDRITPEIKRKIESYRIAKGGNISTLNLIEQNGGKFLHVILILFPFIIYIFLFRKRIYHETSKILLIAITILFVSALSFLVVSVDVSVPLKYLVLVPVAPMLLTIVFDSRVGFYSAVVVSLISGGIQGNDYVFSVINIVAGSFAAYSVRDMKNRTQIFRSFSMIFAGYFFSILAFSLERFAPIQNILIDSSFAAVNALISPALTYGIIIFVERIFNITTDLTLLELTDFNSPLLKNLAKKAPGTFTHSMTIGTLVESAAEKIGANPILARVGAYYHDIGKTLTSEMFVENQMDNKNVHEGLLPEESARLIINHVVKGIELARENNLPEEIINFIPEHHGTMLVSYFYDMAVEKYGKDNVNINDFRYPGPKPQTKETALLMLADACESASRSIEDHDPKKVENMIHNLFQQRIDNGQLNESPLTFKDIMIIKDSFLSGLIGQHHKRIRYPNQEKMENEISSESEE